MASVIYVDEVVAKRKKGQLKRRKQQLKKKLIEMFRVDSPDLNFGVYRIMNQKRGEIVRFMDKDLIEAVDIEFGKYDEDLQAQVAGDIAALERTIRETYGDDALGADGLKEEYRKATKGREFHEKWQKLRQDADDVSMSDVHKAEIFEHLETFFSRYYKDGDFLSLRRYSANEKYAIPYNGEEVLLHWANKDQYYVKTDRFLKGHGFDVGDYRVMFEVVPASDQVDTGGTNRYFILSGGENEVTYDKTKMLLMVRFVHVLLSDDALKNRFPPRGSRKKPNTDDIVDGLTDAILAHGCIPKGLKGALEAKEHENVNPRLRKHVLSFTRESTSDFFIHKDLGGFLRQELDFCIKNEVFRLDYLGTENEVQVERYVKRAKMIKKIANRIIDFLAQLEDFQKMLWEKKKFVLQTDYCMTIDHIPEKFYPEICTNGRQVREWKDLYGIGEGAQQTLNGDVIDVAFMESHPFLVLDTAFFNADFKDRLLEDLQHPDGTPVEDLDEAVGGLMIKSENWQALNLLQERYREQVKCIYIDPPYNTGNDEFIYRDNYQHSSWISMICQRLFFCKKNLRPGGAFFSSIDDHEVHNFRIILNNLFGENNTEIYIWDVREEGNMPKTARNTVRKEHEYILAAFEDKNSIEFQKYQEFKYSENEEWGNSDNDPRGDWMSGNISRGQISSTSGEKYYSITTPTGKVYTRNWTLKIEEYEALLNDNRIYFARDGDGVPRIKIFKDEPVDVIQSSHFEGLSSSQSGKRQIINLFEKCEMSHPKPVPLMERLLKISSGNGDITMDFFAGSGTTAHAVLNLNKEGGGIRKYILIEMGDYFDTITKPRIQKVAYSSNWKDGKPQDTDGQSHIFKYMILEQYEDTLDNIEFLDKDGRLQKTLFSMSDYMLKYFLKFETKGSSCRLNVDRMTTPFAYTLKTQRDSGFDQYPTDPDGFREVPVDLIETFNYLLGLHVIRRITREHNDLTYRVVHGTAPDNRKITVVWRDSPEKPEDHQKELKEDAAFITEEILSEFPDTATLYVNGHYLAPGAVPIEPEFKKLMGA